MLRNVILAASLPATADWLFDMYLDPQAHAAFTGAPVTIEPHPGTPFRAFDGVLTGTMLHVEPKRQIVQTLRGLPIGPPKPSTGCRLYHSGREGTRCALNWCMLTFP